MSTATEANQSQQTGSFATLPHREQRLSPGTIRYREAGSGEPLLFVHGLLVDGRLWDGVAEQLSDRFRCIVPDWPLGSHTTPIGPGADLTAPAISLLVAELIEALGLEAPTVIGNDSGGAITQMLVERRPDAVGRMVLTNCDIDDNFPPFPYNLMPPVARIPGGTRALGLPLRLPPVRRTLYGWLAERPIPDELTESWLAPSASDPRIRANLTNVLATVRKQDLISATASLAGFGRPALFAWAPADRFFPISDAHETAAIMPDAEVVPIEGAKTFVALDQPGRLAEAIAAFLDA